MTKINKIITSQIEARETSDRNDANSYSWEPNGTINYHDSNSIGRKFQPLELFMELTMIVEMVIQDIQLNLFQIMI